MDTKQPGRPKVLDNPVTMQTQVDGSKYEALKARFDKSVPDAEIVRRLVDYFLEPEEQDPIHRCAACGHELQIVRPGKYQCVNENCGA